MMMPDRHNAATFFDARSVPGRRATATRANFASAGGDCRYGKAT